MNNQVAPIRIKVDVTNPGQFFACCGLMELASRKAPESVAGWFAPGEQEFLIQSDSPETGMSAGDLVELVAKAGLASALSSDMLERLKQMNAQSRAAKKAGKQLSKEEETERKRLGSLLRSGPIRIPTPFDLRLDWWRSESESVPKTWAGSQAVGRIADAALSASGSAFKSVNPLDYRVVITAASEDRDDADAPDNDEDQEDESTPTDKSKSKKVEPFYFDSRRGARPFSRDIGFSPDALKMTTTAYPAVEFLCLVGLQRCRPQPTGEARMFDYYTWQVPLSASVLPAAVCGLLPGVGACGYRFENAFRTDQRKHKAFSPAVPLSRRFP